MRVLGPGEVLVFGSVARGDQAAGSDLDLVLVFDDLGDYTQRRDLAAKAQAAVAEATGIASDVRVTDRPEWEIRTRRCQSTFEAHIAAHAVTLASRRPAAQIDWEKQIGLAATDEQQAADTLHGTAYALDGILLHLWPSLHETGARAAGDPDDADKMEHSRILESCAKAQIAMETSLKALLHALKAPHPAGINSIGGLIEAARDHLDEAAASELEAALGPLSSEQASVWREASVYPADPGNEAHAQAATPAFAAQMAEAAIEMTTAAIALVSQQLGYQPDEAKRPMAQCARIGQELPALDTPDRNRQPRISP